LRKSDWVVSKFVGQGSVTLCVAPSCMATA
jgi:hypothetical protein